MIRAGVVLILIAAVAVGALALSGDPGRATVIWLGWRADATAAAAILIALGFGLFAAVIWRAILWVLEAPRRAERARAEARRRQSYDVLARGFLAVAAGDGPEALRLSKKAAEIAAEAPGLVRVLAAQAAEAAGDTGQAQAAYTASTTHGLRNGSVIQRYFRDINAGNAHFLTAEQSVIDAGKVLAGVEGAVVIF